MPEPNKPDYAADRPGLAARRCDGAAALRRRRPGARQGQPTRRTHQAARATCAGTPATSSPSSPAAVLPDTNAQFEGENPQYVYTVRFDSRELWGADAEPFALTIELFESYLEKA